MPEQRAWPDGGWPLTDETCVENGRAAPSRGRMRPRYEDIFRLCYVRGPEGIIVGLAEQLR
ncbi:hypothetical protein FBZ33_2739 [Micromonospora sp. A202]|nr:hypothetical protein FBZ33_2739 [Micromonospora sp. A202]